MKRLFSFLTLSKTKQAWRQVSVWLCALVVLLVAARLALPWFVKYEINKTLNSFPGYHGQVEAVGVSLWRGAYTIHELKLVKTHGSESEPFIEVNMIDIAVDWHALLHGKFASRIRLVDPRLQFVVRATSESSQTSLDGSWQEKVQKFYPFQINLFQIYRGLVRYKDETRDPKINLYFHDMHAEASNITNATHERDALPSALTIESRFLDSGRFELHSDINMLNNPMIANLKGSLEDLQLTELNGFSTAYGHFDFKSGTFQTTFEASLMPDHYTGYVKTLFRKVDIFDWSKDKEKGAGHLVWQGLAAFIVEIFKNHQHDQFAARLPLSGPRQDLEIDKWATVGSILRNAFVQALSPKYEDVVKLHNQTDKEKLSSP